jgi:LPXTG-site transpeptidase (sortase) family protein
MFLYSFVHISYSPVKPVDNITVAPSPEVVDVVVNAIPVRLVIKSINIDTTIYEAGLSSSGDMDISENPDEVAWYKLGPKPGEIGSAVIAGHYGWKDGHGSVFNNIHLLIKGDEVSVYDAEGTETTFVVRETRIYNPEADATKVFTSTDKKAHLNLITCGGIWVNNKDSYSDRLVVFTDLK